MSSIKQDLKNPEPDQPNVYTCNEYRAEMLLLGLNRQLVRAGLSDAEKEKIRLEIEKIETDMGMN